MEQANDEEQRAGGNGHRDAQNARLPATGHADAPSTVSIADTLQAAFAHHQAGRFTEAAAHYQQILSREPDHADAVHFVGLLICDAGDIATGIEWIRRSIGLYPNAIYYNNLGNVLTRRGEHHPAIEAYREAIALRSDYAEAHSNLGNALRVAGDPAAAIDSCAAALALAPGFAEAWNNLGNAFKDHGDADAAMKSYAKALSLRPDYAEAHNNLGNVYEKQSHLVEATACYRQAIALKPKVATMHNNLGNVLRDQGLLDDAAISFRQATTLDPDLLAARSNLLLQLNFMPQVSLEEQIAEARRFGDHQVARLKRLTHEVPTAVASKPRLKIGFVSGDLRTHPVGFFLENVVAQIDTAQIELIAYATQRDEDALTARLKPHFAAWHSLAGLDDETAAHRIRADGIDILVDLSGHTTHNRLSMFAWKPAPVQVSWLGYFATTGVDAIDYILGDRHVLPDDEASHFVERPWRMPDSYVCFTPPAFDIPLGPLPASTKGALTFGCFNHLVKLNDAVVALWSRVLHAVPGSRLHLKTKQLDDASVQLSTSARFAAHGIDVARLTLEGQSPRGELLATYNRVDIALDPYPYPGGVTTVEALWMGVPVLTRRGDRFLSHVGESILNTVDLAGWIAANDDEYVARAVAFAADRDHLMHLKAGLRQQLLASPLCDAPRFARNLEGAFRGMWRQYVAASQTHSHDGARVPRAVNPDRNQLENAPNHAGRIAP
ncbi:O-linked N-acetylglucosamine transferase, SPINDLY family protein [Paraburkholderia saeva]|uniref:protein O-GlcNAc transferase n=1 Tax=Paraburkholderia saeva TaxID=2777537 RepID=A0A9N8X342_9BURK|nr:glycosyltransferase family 41 protein [Paraburkholderia saeva]CAG4905102.1 Photosystem I assembly protein Ycf3 [Paraburkholderia saeva]CAG4908962.1 Photosystem I assembly protein Ycf3 [Paraburkholderia saeva]